MEKPNEICIHITGINFILSVHRLTIVVATDLPRQVSLFSWLLTILGK